MCENIRVKNGEYKTLIRFFRRSLGPSSQFTFILNLTTRRSCT